MGTQSNPAQVLATFKAQYLTTWLQSQPQEYRDVAGMKPLPTEDVTAFFARWQAAALSAYGAVGEVFDGDLEQGADPLTTMQIRNNLGWAEIPSFYGGGSLPVPQVVVDASGNIDTSTQGMATTMANLLKLYPPQSDMVVPYRPFGIWPINRNPLQYIPGPGDVSPVGATYVAKASDKDLPAGAVFVKTNVLGQAGAQGTGVMLWQGPAGAVSPATPTVI